MEITTNTLAAKLGVKYPVAAALIELAIKTNQAKEVSVVKSPSGKGKPSKVFFINKELKFTIGE